MSKDPAFLLYPQDFLVGTMTMTNEQVGKYVRLLCLQHQTGHLTEDDMLDICEAKDAKIWRKFKQDESGLYFNERLKLETEKRRKYSESRRNNRTKKDNICKTYEPHMENVNEDEDVIKKESKNKKCLMKNSGIEIKSVKEAFLKTEDLNAADAKYYFNAALDWSDSTGEMRKDWIATMRTFARRDLKDGKLKLSIHKPQTGSNLGGEKLPEDYGVASKTAVTMPDRLKKSISNIGKG